MRTQLTLLATAALLAACDAPTHQSAVAATSSAPASVSIPNNAIIAGTPAGDLDTWVKEMRAGIAQLPALLKDDVASAQRKALELYVTRQEYSEMYYGPHGRLRATDELASAIGTAEERFHALMKLLGTSNPSADAVKSAIDALDSQQALVSKLWQRTGAHIDRTSAQ
jgi:hypothetical protein